MLPQVTREVPFLVEAAGTCIDFHRHSRCRRCHPTGWCPVLAAARARIVAWRRTRPW
ncbi:hypothetical protein ACH47V_23755 [Micromonospora chersina]|uniref:hypothetical protein n=1 Tax=Micromonospora chersina TaxID=47854 RepID=UPI0033D72FAF